MSPFAAAAALALCGLFALSAQAAVPEGSKSEPQSATKSAFTGSDEDSIDAERLYSALVRVQTTAVPNARSNATLGREREGTGTVIGKGGVILTIGYLVVEADDVKVTDSQGRTYPARVLAYDHATGLGLIKTSVPFNVPPVP